MRRAAPVGGVGADVRAAVLAGPWAVGRRVRSALSRLRPPRCPPHAPGSVPGVAS